MKKDILNSFSSSAGPGQLVRGTRQHNPEIVDIFSPAVMFSTAKSFWGSATNALTNVATFADTIVKDLAEDSTEGHERGDRAEDVAEYRKMLNELEMQQVELSKQSRLALAQKQAEVESYKRKLREFVPDDNALEQIGSALGEGDVLRLQAEKDALQQTSLQLQEQLQVFMNEVTDAKVKARKLEELEKRFLWMKTELSGRVEELEANIRIKELETENLVDEYSKLAADSDHARSEDCARLAIISKENEVLSTKVQALEQALTNVADRSYDSKHGAVTSSSLEELKGLQFKISQLNELLLKKDDEIEKITNVYKQACDELKKFVELQSTVSSNPTNEDGLKQELHNVTEMLRSSQEQLKVLDSDFAKRLAMMKSDRDAETARLQAQHEKDIAAITEGFTAEIKRLEAEAVATSGQQAQFATAQEADILAATRKVSDALTDSSKRELAALRASLEAAHTSQISEMKAGFEAVLLRAKTEDEELRCAFISLSFYIYISRLLILLNVIGTLQASGSNCTACRS